MSAATLGRPRVSQPVTPELGKIGENIRDARIDAGWSVDQACAQAEIDRSTWYRIEGGQHNIPLMQLLSIADVLGVHQSDLIDFE